MKSKLAIMTSVGVAAGLVAGCGGGDHGQAATPPPPPMTSTVPLTTADVLALAKKTSDTDAPIAVNSGVVTISDTSETASPISINGL